VFGARVARSLGDALPHLRQPGFAPTRARDAAGCQLHAKRPAGEEDAVATESEVRRLMWERVGLVRTGAGLGEALGHLTALAERDAKASTPLGNLVLVARLVATAALARTDSRGAHYRADHPLADPAGRCRILLTPDEAGAAVVSTGAAPAARATAEEVCA
jgi:aspartate oxidase